VNGGQYCLLFLLVLLLVLLLLLLLLLVYRMSVMLRERTISPVRSIMKYVPDGSPLPLNEKL